MIRTSHVTMTLKQSARVQAIGDEMVRRSPALIASCSIWPGRIDHTTRVGERLHHVVVVFDEDDSPADIIEALLKKRADLVSEHTIEEETTPCG